MPESKHHLLESIIKVEPEEVQEATDGLSVLKAGNLSEKIIYIEKSESNIFSSQAQNISKLSDTTIKSLVKQDNEGLRNFEPHTCRLCQKVLSSRSNLEKHLRRIHLLIKRIKQYTCNVCDYKTSCKQNLENHKNHTIRKCSSCDQVFRKQVDLRRHNLEKHCEEKVTCRVCHGQYTTKYGFNRHWRAMHLDSHGEPNMLRVLRKKEPFICDKCGLKLPNRISFQTHYNQNHRSTTVFCKLCPRSFFKQPNLVRHMRREHPQLHLSDCKPAETTLKRLKDEKFEVNGIFEPMRLKAGIFSDPIVLLERLDFKMSGSSDHKKNIYKSKKKTGASAIAMTLAKKGNENLSCLDPHVCCFCGKLSSSRYALRSHIDTVHCKSRKLFCDLCPKYFFNRTHILTHMVTVHSKKNFSCNICDYKTASKRVFLFHKMTHNAKAPCPICNKQVSSMKRHIAIHKPKESCPICFKLFQKRCLKNHMKTHTRIKDAQKCRNCKDTFENKEDLRRHKLRKHFDGKLHECHCGSVFQYKCQLERHQQSHNNEKKKSSCEVCQKQFSSRDGLTFHWRQEHSKTHGKIESNKLRSLNTKGPFICDQCGSTLSTRASLRAHNTQNHRSNAIRWCDLCPRSFDQKCLLVTHLEKDHLRLRPFECKVCGHKSSTRQLLKFHMRVHGPKTKCKICQKLVVNIYKHSRTHVEVECPICKKICTKKHVSNHVKSHERL